MKIAIIGTRGIPNNYSGFEQFAEYLSQHLVKSGHEVYVYNSHNHIYQEKEWKGVNIIHKMDPEYIFGTFGQFIYDFNSILDSRKRGYDAILQLGYTSSSVWGWLLPKKSIIFSNMDGLEWKRSKYSKPVRYFLKYAEKWAIKTSDFLISDSLGIQDYLQDKYGQESEYIAYGAKLFNEPSEQIIKEYGVDKYQYDMLIARFEPENNLEVILDGVVASKKRQTFLVVGNHQTKFGGYLKNKFKDYQNIRFLGGIFNIGHLNNLRYYSNLYFHGHSVGGTNPSLLEAMASNCFIIAHDNLFNKGILGKDAEYFSNSDDVAQAMNLQKSDHVVFVENNKRKIDSNFRWDIINKKYEDFICSKL
mgnify:CR=1 FL=1